MFPETFVKVSTFSRRKICFPSTGLKGKDEELFVWYYLSGTATQVQGLMAGVGDWKDSNGIAERERERKKKRIAEREREREEGEIFMLPREREEKFFCRES